MRGKQSSPVCPVILTGLIPAHAGKTLQPLAWLPASWAHPRACGENDAQRPGLTGGEGSSPRMRGKLYECPPVRFLLGLIPAHAGKTYSRPSPTRRRQAHPRACGENAFAAWNDFTGGGSSPRMRGKHQLVYAARRRTRLIPAHAGKTFYTADAIRTYAAHPRACGENVRVHCPWATGPGSSPRMRGKRSSRNPAAVALGLIPAHAGKTNNASTNHVSCWAHPRACGENTESISDKAEQAGSSPRMRGKQTKKQAK